MLTLDNKGLTSGDTISVLYELSGDDDLVEFFESNSTFFGVIKEVNYKDNLVWVEDCPYAISIDLVYRTLSS